MTISAYLDEQGLLRLKHGDRELKVRVALHSILEMQEVFKIDILPSVVQGIQNTLTADGVKDVSFGEIEALIKPLMTRTELPKADPLPEAPKKS